MRRLRTLRGNVRCVAGLLIAGVVAPGAFAQAQKKEMAPKRIAIRAGRLIDGKSDAVIGNALILIEGDKIVSVTPGGSAPAGTEILDLSKSTVMPSLPRLRQ